MTACSIIGTWIQLPITAVNSHYSRAIRLLIHRVALVGNFLSGAISVILGVLGPHMLTIIPPAALLVPLAGVGLFAFLGLEQAVAVFSAPMVGFLVRCFRSRYFLYCRIFVVPCYVASNDSRPLFVWRVRRSFFLSEWCFFTSGFSTSSAYV